MERVGDGGKVGCRGLGEGVSAVREMVGRGLASGRVEVQRVCTSNGRSFDARVAEVTTVEGRTAPWWLEQRVARSWGCGAGGDGDGGARAGEGTRGGGVGG